MKRDLLYVNNRVIAADSDAFVYAMDPQSGEVLWATQLHDRTTITASPLVVNDTLYVVDERGILHALSLEDGTVFMGCACRCTRLQYRRLRR